MSRFNLDAVAGQLRAPVVEQAVNQARQLAWADPNSLHFAGKQAAQLLAISRESVGRAIGVSHDQVGFGVSSVEVVRRLIELWQPSVVCYSSIERQVVIEGIRNFRPSEVESADPAAGPEIREIAVDSSGQLVLPDLAAALADVGSTPRGSALVFVQWANQEIGTVQDLAAIGKIVRSSGAKLVVDATAALGYLSPLPDPPPWDYLFADSASWGGSQLATVVATTVGSANSAGISDSTSVAAAATAAVTLESLRTLQPAESARLASLREQLENFVAAQFPTADLVDPGPNRLPHVTSFSLPYVDAEALAVELDRLGVAIGSGSACANDVGVPSHVLAAVGSLTQGNVRIGLPIDCPPAAIERLLELLPQVTAELTADLTSGSPVAYSPPTDPDDAVELDERGALCPHPVIELAKAANRSIAGSTIYLITDDPAALSDVPAWARLQQAEVISQESWEALANSALPATRFGIRIR